MPSRQRVLTLPTDKIAWDDLRFFLEVAEKGSLRAAASALGVTVTTVSRHVENLERALGETLILRRRQGVEVTPVGIEMLPDIRELAALVDRMGDKILASAAQPSGRVRIAVSEGLATYWLAPRLMAFQKANPFVTIETISTMTLAEVARVQPDIAVQLQRPTDPDHVAVRLAKLHMCLFMSRDYARAHGTPTALGDLEGHHLLFQASDPLDTDILQQMLGIAEIQGRVAFSTNTSSILYMLIAKGAGIGFLPNYSIALGADLVSMDLGRRHAYDIWLGYDRSLRRSTVKSMVLDWIKESFDPRRFPWFAQAYQSPEALAALPDEAWAVNRLPLPLPRRAPD